jgi:hypothetical protein
MHMGAGAANRVVDRREPLGPVDEDLDGVAGAPRRAGVTRPEIAVRRRVERPAVPELPEPPAVVRVDGSLEGVAQAPIGAVDDPRCLDSPDPTGRGRPGRRFPVAVGAKPE